MEHGPEHDYTTGKTVPQSRGEHVGNPCRVGVRVAPRYGPGDVPEPPPLDWTVAHIQRLSARWRIEPDSICAPGMASPADSVEMVFLIPAGQVREFEQDAAGAFARVFRPG